MVVFVKVLATVLVTAFLTSPWWWPASDGGILRELALLGAGGSTLAIVVFFGLVALYCQLLERTLRRIDPVHRTVSPRSVWWMFAIPFNFVEDFFIIGNVAASLRAAGAERSTTIRRWAILGWAWCSLQILSLFPGELGRGAGVLAILAWVTHWVFTARIHARLGWPSPEHAIVE